MKKVFVVDQLDNRNKIVAKLLIDNNFTCISLEDFRRKEPDLIHHIFVLAPSTKLDEDDISKIPCESTVFYFLLDNARVLSLKQKKCDLICVMKNALYVAENSKLTAEGALKYVIENTDLSLEHQNILVLGYGNLGKALANILGKLSLNFHIATANNDELELARSKGYSAINIHDTMFDLASFDTVINTIPAKIFEDNITLKANAYVLELASNIYPFDYTSPMFEHIKYTIAKGVPGVTSKLSSGKLLFDTILAYIK